MLGPACFVSVCGSCRPRLGTGSLQWGSRVSCGSSSALRGDVHAVPGKSALLLPHSRAGDPAPSTVPVAEWAQSPLVPILSAHTCEVPALAPFLIEDRGTVTLAARLSTLGTRGDLVEQPSPPSPELPHSFLTPRPSSGRAKGWVSRGWQEKGDGSAPPNVPLEEGAG